jgi:3-mercaptopyruvate sulfurtransferase SseA
VINGELKTVDELNEIFIRQGVNFERPIIASCGSGVTAAVVVLALTTLPERRRLTTLVEPWGARTVAHRPAQ